MGTSVYIDHHHLSGRNTCHEHSLTHAYDGGESSHHYSSDEFRMYEFKIRRCTRSRSHDWTDCPFAHPGEKARRRDPLNHPYSASVCPDFRRSGGLSCPRGDGCGLAHGVFESRLHPSRYRTEACKDGPHCPRKVCFFAHSPSQLRRSPPVSYEAALIRSLVSSLRVDVVQDPFISSLLTLTLTTTQSTDSFDANGFVDPDLGWVDELLM